MNIIKNDEFVADLSEEQLAKLAKLIDDSYEDDVFLFETIHGHIAEFKKKEGRYIPGSEDSPARLTMEDFALFQEVGVRWVEVACGWLKVAV